MASPPSGSEGVVAVRHPRGLDPHSDAWIGQAADAQNRTYQPADTQLTVSDRSRDRFVAINKRTFLTDFPQQGWIAKATVTLYEAAGHVDWYAQTQSFRLWKTGPGIQNDKPGVYTRQDQPQQIWLSGSLLDVPLFMQGVLGNLDQPKTPKVKWWTERPPDQGWITKNSGLVYDPITYWGWYSLTQSFRTDRRNVQADKRYGTPFKRESAQPDPRNTNAAWQQLFQSELARQQLWAKSPLWRQANALDVSAILPRLPQAPWTTAQWPAIDIRSERARKRNQDVRITTLSDGYITANLVAPSFDAKWLVAVDQLVNSYRNTYVQQLALSPGLGKGLFGGGGLVPPPPPFDATTFPWFVDTFVMRKGFQWPKLTDQKASFCLLDPASIQDILAAQTASYLAGRNPPFKDFRWRQRHEWSDAAFESQVAVAIFDPIRMSSNFVLNSFQMPKGHKWFTSDPAELSWLIPNVVYDVKEIWAGVPGQAQSFRLADRKIERRPWIYDPDNGWLFTGTPPFDPRNVAWVVPGEAMRKGLWALDRRQRTYDPDNAWNVFRPEVIDWTNHDTRSQPFSTKRHDAARLSDFELAWIEQQVPATDPTTYMAVIELLNAFMARGLYRDVRQLTEMVQISWLFVPDSLEANIPVVIPPTPIDQDPHFTSSPTVTPYWLVYPRRSRHRRNH